MINWTTHISPNLTTKKSLTDSSALTPLNSADGVLVTISVQQTLTNVVIIMKTLMRSVKQEFNCTSDILSCSVLYHPSGSLSIKRVESQRGWDPECRMQHTLNGKKSLAIIHPSALPAGVYWSFVCTLWVINKTKCPKIVIAYIVHSENTVPFHHSCGRRGLCGVE